MTELRLQGTATGHWHSLVCEAAAASEQRLDEGLESYLVFLLMRFTERPEFASRIMALEFLEALRSAGHLQEERLRDVGDQCLLYSGLYPGRAERRNLKIGYFVGMGRSAYDRLAHSLPGDGSELFGRLCEGFESLRRVLLGIRKLEATGTLEHRADLRAWQALASPLLSTSPTGDPNPTQGPRTH